MPPVIILKGKDDELIPPNFTGILTLKSKMSWMNSKLFKRWISYPFAMWIPNSVLLIFDSARCYTLRDTLDFLNAKKILYCVIPGGGTPYLQPAEFM